MTLVELLMVTAIIAVLAAIAMPRIRIDAAHVDAAARTINLSLMAAQRDAVARQHDVVVVFDTAAKVLRAHWDADADGATDTGEHTRIFPLPERVVLGRPTGVPALGNAATMPAMRSTPRGPALTLRRNGSADRAATIYLTTRRAMLGGADKDVRALVIARATARPTWFAWAGTYWRRGL